MSQLQAKLDGIRADFESRAPKEALAVMHRSTNDLIESGLAGQAAGPGDEFPDFELQTANGNSISSDQVFGTKPVIVNFFRGFW